MSDSTRSRAGAEPGKTGCGSKPWHVSRNDLDTDPKISAIAKCTGLIDQVGLTLAVTAAIGAVERLWAVANQHSEDGTLKFLTSELLDQQVGIPGFSEAMERVGWLVIRADSIEIPEFEKYNGSSAKRRAKDAERQRRKRARDAGRANESHEAELSEAQPKTATPETAADDRSQDEQWAVVLGKLESAGLADSFATVEAARGKGLTPESVIALTAEYTRRRHEFRSPGVIYWRITRGAWPEPGSGLRADIGGGRSVPGHNETSTFLAEEDRHKKFAAKRNRELDELAATPALNDWVHSLSDERFAGIVAGVVLLPSKRSVWRERTIARRNLARAFETEQNQSGEEPAQIQSEARELAVA